MQKKNKLRGLLRAALAACVLFGAATARAEVLDDVELRADGNDAVVRISFGVRVQYMGHAPLDRADLVEISFLLVSNNAQQTTVEEFRRLPAVGTFPAVSINYPVQLVSSTKRIKVQFARSVRFRVRPGRDNRSLEIVIPGGAAEMARAAPAAAPPPAPAPKPEAVPPPAVKPVPPPAAPAPAPIVVPVVPVPVPAPVPAPPREQQFAVTLQTFPTAAMRGARPVPSEFQDYVVFTSQTVREGKTEFELNLGYFATREAAEQARRALAARFPSARVLDLAQRREETLRAAAALPVPAAPAVPPPPPLPPKAAAVPPKPPAAAPPVAPAAEPDVEKRAATLLAQGRAALDAGNTDAAIDALNQLLILPPNRSSQDAQELIGVARERAGELAKAKVEYELYLSLFPQGAGADRVRDRLAKLDTALAAAPAARAAAPARPALRTFNGSVSQFYYGGRSKIETAFNTPTTSDRATLSSVDQSMLVTNVDLNGRYRDADSDTRLVFRDTYNWSFLDTIKSYNRLNAAYVDYRGMQHPLSTKVGRQTGLNGGVPARFDGAVGGVGFAEKWRFNVVGGAPVEYPKIESKRYFYGLNLDFENLADHWHGNLYAVNQTTDGILDRRAVGTELRYFDAGRTLYGLVDYDVSYNVFNITMLQATLQTQGGTVINGLYDRRRAPTLTTTNAILGQPTTSIKQLLATSTEEQLRQQALDITAVATQGLLGFTTPVSERWQIGADVRVTNVGALPATVINNIEIPAQPATGNIWTYALQTIGSRLYSTRDINVFSAQYLTSPTFRGQLYSYSNVSVVFEDWTLQPTLRYYTQKDTFDVRLSRFSPGLRITYQVRQNVALEGEYVYELSHTVAPMQSEDAARQYWYVGYRFDF
jgi:tetratricopeptide (TPR) repeat protein